MANFAILKEVDTEDGRQVFEVVQDNLEDSQDAKRTLKRGLAEDGQEYVIAAFKGKVAYETETIQRATEIKWETPDE